MRLKTKTYSHFSRIPAVRRPRTWLLFALPVIALISGFILFGPQKPARATPCPCNVFTGTPSPSTDTDSGGIEVGFKFSSALAGYISGVRFYKAPTMTGAHTVNLWDVNGNLLATAPSGSETASGWQEVSFSSPVAITANTIYTASMFAANGVYPYTSNYFSSDVVNFPLTAPADGSAPDGLGWDGQGVFNTGNSSTYPFDSFNATNYWVDVAYRANLGASAPTVSSTTPTANATGVNPGHTLTATFDDAMDDTTLTTSTFVVRDSGNNTQTGTVSYSHTTKTASFIPTNGLDLGETYTATIEGGTGTVAANMEGIALAADHSWSFTVAADDPCPCTLKDRTNPSGSAPVDDASGIEVGVKVKPAMHGYITAVRFYKPIISTQTTHTATIWNSSGTSLATVTFNNETDYGWQEAALTSPLEVQADQLYVVSYYAPDGVYQSTVGGMASNLGSGDLIAYANDSTENAATGSGNRNGATRSGSTGYPNSGSASGNYFWIDAVFNANSDPEYPLSVNVTQPAANAIGIMRDKPITATFNRPLDGGTVTNTTFRLFDSSNNQIAGTGNYNGAKGEATFTPGSNLTYGQRYTARLSASIADDEGITLGSEYSWSFTVGSALLSDPTEGPGGPMLVITTNTDKYSTYYAEILRAEGLSYFDVADISTVNTSTLANYNAVIVSEMSLTQGQADMLSDWVTAGGNLIAMRPDSKLASLLGLISAGTTRSNQYLLVNTASAPGTGIVNETIQFKGTADNYTVNGATSLAAFYSDASTATANPAVTTRQVGSNGGTAAAFTYDLAKSVIAQHQGNQAWAGQNRDGNGPTRPNDLFFGSMTGDVQPDWVDLNKLHIPQADEQQRLLANMVIEATKDKRPLPRFWYLPGDHEAALVFAGDDHGQSNATGTERILSDWLAESPTNCSVLDWQCVRASHYFYESSALTNSRAQQFYTLGFDMGDHIQNGCSNFSSYANLGSAFTSDLTTWRAKYTSLPNQTTHRFHCYVWSDWDSQMRVDADNGIRYDLNYVAYPLSWVNGRSPLMTGSGMNMRFTDADGDLMDVYQGVTNLDDTAANSTSIAALLDNAQGASGYYGLFGTHYDMNNTYEDTLLAAAKARNIPLISSAQALAWLDGRGSSTFSNFTGSNGQFGFTINPAVGAIGLRAMLPTQDAGGTLSTLTLNGSTVSYQTQTVKGMQYAVFNANPGAYTATYSDYNPGGSGGSGGGGGSGGTTSNPATKKSSGNTVFQADDTPEAVTPANSQSAPEETEPTENPKPAEAENNPSTGEEASSKTWIWWLGGLVIAIAALTLLLFVLTRRRHSADG